MESEKITLGPECTGQKVVVDSRNGTVSIDREVRGTFDPATAPTIIINGSPAEVTVYHGAVTVHGDVPHELYTDACDAVIHGNVGTVRARDGDVFADNIGECHLSRGYAVRRH